MCVGHTRVFCVFFSLFFFLFEMGVSRLGRFVPALPREESSEEGWPWSGRELAGVCMALLD